MLEYPGTPLRQGKKTVESLSCPFPEHGVLCSYLFSNSSMRSNLQLRVPRPGNYTVEIVMGEPSAMVSRVAQTYVWGPGSRLLGIGRRLPVPGEFASTTFVAQAKVPVAAGEAPSLTLSLGGMAVSQYFQFDDRNNGTAFFEMAWMANTMFVREGTGSIQHTHAASSSLRDHGVVGAGVRDWLVLGPLDDSNGTFVRLV